MSTTQDTTTEGDETFKVTISATTANPLPGGVTIVTASAIGTIEDDDGVTVSVEPASATEGSTVTFKAKLSVAVGSNVVLGWSTGNDDTSGARRATAGTDYTAVTNGSVTIDANQTEASFMVSTAQDSTTEGDETFKVTITGTTLPGGVTIATASAIGTIQDDDGVTVSVEGASATEGSTVTFKATLSAAVGSNVVLGWTTGDDDTTGARQATAGTDYTSVTNGSVTIDANQTEASFTVSTAQDSATEGDETFKVTIRETTANPLPGGVTIATGQRHRHDPGRRRGDGVGGGCLRDRRLDGDVQGDAVCGGELERGAGLDDRRGRHERSEAGDGGHRLHGGDERQRDDRGDPDRGHLHGADDVKTRPPRATRHSR